jgi:hypothetical protein
MVARPHRDEASSSPLVYVVDDDADLRQTVIEILALAGVAAEGLGSGSAAQASCADAGQTRWWSISASPTRRGSRSRPG